MENTTEIQENVVEATLEDLKSKKGIIYKITNKINGKSYIGQTIHSFYQRYKGAKWYKYTQNEILINAYK